MDDASIDGASIDGARPDGLRFEDPSLIDAAPSAPMPNAPGGSVTGYGFCFPFGPTATILRAAGTTTSPVFVAAAETGPASAGNTDSTLTCTGTTTCTCHVGGMPAGNLTF